MKFKVGDKVRVVERGRFNHDFGSILTITKVCENSTLPYEASDDDGYVIRYDEDELELVKRRNNMKMDCGTRIKAELKDLTLKKDDNGYYLEAAYEVDRLDGVYELTIPHIELPVNFHRVDINEFYDDDFGFFGPMRKNLKIDLGFGFLPLKEVKDKELGKCCFKEKLIRSKVQEMTLSEIEAKLGHKIKIVNEKEE